MLPELSSHIFGVVASPFVEYLFANALFYNLITAIILVHQSLIIRKLNDYAEFWSKGTSLPSLFYVTFCVSLTQFNILFIPYIIGNYFILYTLHKYITLYEEINLKKLFYLGFYSGIAIVFHFPLIYLVLTSILFLIVYINASIKLHLVYYVGIACSIILISTTYFLLDMLSVFHQDNIFRFLQSRFSPESLTTENLFIGTFLIILSLMGVSNVSNYFNRMNVRTRAVWGILFLLTLISIIVTLFTTDGKLIHFYFLGIVFSFLTGRIFYLFKKNITGELIFLVLLFLIINFQYSLFF